MNKIDEKIKQLLEITDQFIFIEHYTHTGEKMYKIENHFTNYAKETLVLCKVSQGIEMALDLAIQEIEIRKKEFFE